MKEYSEIAIKRSKAAGWLTRVRHIDKDASQPLLGVRLTNAAALFGRALSVTIFDRSTVALSFGYTNDETVKLTEEDGAAFVDWMRHEGRWIAPDEEAGGDASSDAPCIDWEAIPEHAQEPPLFVTNVTDLAKNDLVTYLVQNHPEQFGRYATGRAAAGEFYNELRALIENPERDQAGKQRVITELVTMAHDAYHQCNAHLREWRILAGPSAYEHYQEARALIRMAELLRIRADALGFPLNSDEFPEAISADSLIDAESQVR